MAGHRFYLAPNEWTEDTLTLRGDEARHCSQVVRCSMGERVAVFDGRGREADGTIESIAAGEVAVRVRSDGRTARPPVALTLCQAVPKGKNMDLIVQKATELGATTIAPLLSDRTVVRLDADEAARKRDKWQRVALEACKQCGQNWLPEVKAPLPVADYLRGAGGGSAGELRLIAAIDDRARPLKTIVAETGSDMPAVASIMIGPEGDFTPAEMDAAINAGFLPMTLGPIVLRSETAAIYSLSVLSHELAQA